MAGANSVPHCQSRVDPVAGGGAGAAAAQAVQCAAARSHQAAGPHRMTTELCGCCKLPLLVVCRRWVGSFSGRERRRAYGFSTSPCCCIGQATVQARWQRETFLLQRVSAVKIQSLVRMNIRRKAYLKKLHYEQEVAAVRLQARGRRRRHTAVFASFRCACAGSLNMLAVCTLLANASLPLVGRRRPRT